MVRNSVAAFALLVSLTPAAAQETKAIPQPVSGQTSPWPVSKVIGLSVYNGQNEPIGKIADLVMDSQARVANVIVSVGGSLGVKERLVQVPLDVLRFPKDAAAPNNYPSKAALNVTKDTLMGMPQFQY
jgi:sporulation protein YlmC with PRC-barrel domain